MLMLSVPVLLGVSTVAFPDSQVGYVIRSAWFQAGLLLSRRPVAKLRAQGKLTPEQEQAVDTIDDVKKFGASIGLSSTDNYQTIAWKWKRRIWNLSACDPIAFQPRTWWFPVVGRVPYLGYFREKDADHEAEKLRNHGYDVYVRTAGAYSTLGWFRDPILMPMLRWSTYDLAETVLHELTHATVWIPGSVQFNESFANFVGEEAAFRYLAHRYGPDSDEVKQARADQDDLDRWRDLEHGVYADLDGVYEDPSLSDADKLSKKQAIFASLDQRVDAEGFADPERFHRAVERGTWNNARLVQFRTYNDNRAWFAQVLKRDNGDLLAFMHDIQKIVAGADDPFEALHQAVDADGGDVPQASGTQ
jgi:Predicted aminopeptidase